MSIWKKIDLWVVSQEKTQILQGHRSRWWWAHLKPQCPQHMQEMHFSSSTHLTLTSSLSLVTRAGLQILVLFWLEYWQLSTCLSLLPVGPPSSSCHMTFKPQINSLCSPGAHTFTFWPLSLSCLFHRRHVFFNLIFVLLPLNEIIVHLFISWTFHACDLPQRGWGDHHPLSLAPLTPVTLYLSSPPN